MAGVKISGLPAITTPALTDEFATVQAGTTYKVTSDQLLDLNNANDRVRLATTGALTATYDNGAGTLTNSGALAALSIDSVTTVAGNRVLVKDQASTFQNGIYTVTTVGDGATAWVLTRATDADVVAEIDQGDFYTVGAGTVNEKTQWIQTEVVATLGTDPILFESNVTAGAGLTKTTNTIALTDPVSLTLGGTNNTSMVADNGAIVYSDAARLQLLAATETAGQMMRSGSNAAPTWSTATFAATYGASELLFSNGANAVAGLATANSAMLSTDASGVPSWSASATDGQLLIGSTGAQPALNTITPGTGISVANAGGSITISATGGGFAVATISGTSQAGAVNTMYIALNAGQTTLTLPAVFSVGDTISLVGSNANAAGWIIQLAAGDVAMYIGTATSGGGTLTSAAAAGQTIELVADVANSSWVVVDAAVTTLTTA